MPPLRTFKSNDRSDIPLARKLFWRCRQTLFEKHDYLLPDSMSRRSWSSLGGSKLPLCHPNGIEAYHYPTSRFVYIKKAPTREVELPMILHLKLQESQLIERNSLHQVMEVFEDEDNSDAWVSLRERIKPSLQKFADQASDNEKEIPERNPVPELLDVFLDDEDEEICFIVMPLLHSLKRTLHSSGETMFQTVGDVVDFCVKLLEGVHFLNRQMTYHQNIDENDVVIDSKGNPYLVDYSESVSGPAFYAKYPHVVKVPSGSDFGGFHFPQQDAAEKDMLEDVRCTGRVMMLFLSRYSNLEFLRPFLERMINQSYSDYSAKRVDHVVAAKKLIKLRDGMNRVRLGMPLHERDNRVWQNIKLSAKGLFRMDKKKIVPNY